MARFIDRTGIKYGRLTALRLFGKNKRGESLWECVCDCGNPKITVGSWLSSGETGSCGCWERESRHFHTLTHGMSRKKNVVYAAWCRLRGRCLNKNSKDYPDYGGRGITVCERWNDFTLFLADVGERPSPKHSIDRIDTNGNYEPGNCRWATPKIQSNNRRNIQRFDFRGESKTLTEWAESSGIQMRTLFARIYYSGWSVERALTTPVKS